MTPDHVLLLRLGARWPSPRRLWRHRRHRLFLKGYGMNLFEGLEQYVRESRPRFEEWLGRLVEIPTVSMDPARRDDMRRGDRKSTRLNSSHGYISYAVFCLKKKKKE